MASFLVRALYEKIMRNNPAPLAPISTTITISSRVTRDGIAELVRKEVARNPLRPTPP